MNRSISAMQTSAGEGSRLFPLNLGHIDSYDPKGLFRLSGVDIAALQLTQFRDAGIEDVHVIAKDAGNRQPLSSRLSDGRRFGVRIQYSSPADDASNKGSGDAVLTYLERHPELKGDVLLLANDNLYEGNFRRYIQAHRDSNAVVSILTTRMPPRNTIEAYGIVPVDGFRALAVGEKLKSDDEIRQIMKYGSDVDLTQERVHVNTAGYIIDADGLSQLSNEPWVVAGRIPDKADMAGWLVKGLIENGYQVNVIPIDAWGDLGSLSTFLDTFPEVLSGVFPAVHKALSTSRKYKGGKNYHHDGANNNWISTDALKKRNKHGETLDQLLSKGLVELGTNNYIGRDVEVRRGARINHSDVEKYTVVDEGANLERVYLAGWNNIGTHASLRDCALGENVVVESSEGSQTYVNGRTVVAPRIIIPSGTKMHSVTVYPSYRFSGSGEFRDTRLFPSDDMSLEASFRAFGFTKAEDFLKARQLGLKNVAQYEAHLRHQDGPHR